jgi:DNA-binding response OmpR family regulator
MAKGVLIVEDNEHLRQILASILRFSGYEILEARTGAQAIEKALAAKPNLYPVGSGSSGHDRYSHSQSNKKTRRLPASLLLPAVPGQGEI